MNLVRPFISAFKYRSTIIRNPISSTFSRTFTSSKSHWSTDSTAIVHDTHKLLSRPLTYLKPGDITPLKEARSIYARVHLYNRNFLVTKGDKIMIPVRIKDIQVGDELVLDQVSEIGSRDHTLSGDERIDPSVFTIKARVIEITRVKKQIRAKHKPRRRHVRHIFIKNVLTVLRVSELKVN